MRRVGRDDRDIDNGKAEGKAEGKAIGEAASVLSEPEAVDDMRPKVRVWDGANIKLMNKCVRARTKKKSVKLDKARIKKTDDWFAP